MRLRSALLLAAATAAAPAAARAQAGPPAFTEVFSTFGVAGCSQFGFGPTDVAPCVTGTATFGRLTAATFGVRFDLAADFSTFRGPLPLLGARLANESEFTFSTAGLSAADCFAAAGRFDGERCRQDVRVVGADFNAADVLPGQTATYLRTLDMAGPFGVNGRPETFRVEQATLIYNVRDAQGTGSRQVRPAITAAVVPEPSTFALAGVGGLALAGAAARRRATRG
jgi:hypothetical protein